MNGVYWFICCREGYAPALPKVTGTQVDFNRRATDAIAGLRRSRRGIGDLLPRPVAKAIEDHLLCDGAAVSRRSFPQLFNEIGTEWGVGDGSTTFNLPNLTGDPLPLPEIVPAQSVSTGGTVSLGGTVTTPTAPGQVGGTVGGNVTTGGRPFSKFNRIEEALLDNVNEQ